MLTMTNAVAASPVTQSARRPFAEPRLVTDRQQCHFYHSLDLPNGELTGVWDLRGRIEDYIGHVDIAGKSVIDVGTASGFLTFEMERLGGRLTSFDAESSADIAYVPVKGDRYVTDHQGWCQETDAFLGRLKNGYWFAHRELGSRAQALYGNIYELGSYGHRFDVAVIAQVLVHLKDPVNALAAVASVCDDTLIITEGTIDSPAPDARLCARAATNGPGYMWWQCSVPFYREVLAMQGFEVVSATPGTYTCYDAYCPGENWLTTIVARRVK
jgi:2-polyprenyl-3-methyl-5-hydroxy-6-metoxy-1,4-benzoquinol methylase